MISIIRKMIFHNYQLVVMEQQKPPMRMLEGEGVLFFDLIKF